MSRLIDMPSINEPLPWDLGVVEHRHGEARITNDGRRHCVYIVRRGGYSRGLSFSWNSCVGCRELWVTRTTLIGIKERASRL